MAMLLRQSPSRSLLLRLSSFQRTRRPCPPSPLQSTCSIATATSSRLASSSSTPRCWSRPQISASTVSRDAWTKLSPARRRRQHTSTQAAAGSTFGAAPGGAPGSGSSRSRPTSSHVSFYQVYGRPILKMLLMAFFTYQVVYSIWMKLEGNEMTALREAEIRRLEKQVRDLARQPQR